MHFHEYLQVKPVETLIAYAQLLCEAPLCSRVPATHQVTLYDDRYLVCARCAAGLETLIATSKTQWTEISVPNAE
jgi:hypothetical protein